MSSARNQQGIIRNAFYTVNQRKEGINTFMDKEQRINTERFRYEVNEKGELVIIKLKKK